MNKLKELSILAQDNQITDEGASDFINNISKLSQLESI
jgi:hypothetical protein